MPWYVKTNEKGEIVSEFETILEQPKDRFTWGPFDKAPSRNRLMKAMKKRERQQDTKILGLGQIVEKCDAIHKPAPDQKPTIVRI